MSNPEPVYNQIEMRAVDKKIVSMDIKFYLALVSGIGALALSGFRVSERFYQVAGGEAVVTGRVVTVNRSPTTIEVATGVFAVPTEIAPVAAVIQARVTSTGALKALTGNIALDATNNLVTFTNAGATQFDANDTITMFIWG